MHVTMPTTKMVQYIVVCENGRRKRILADFVGRFESLEEDFTRTMEAVGADATSYRGRYDGRLAAMVGKRYSLDAEIFGYSF